jgi:hypothetical protein
MMKKEESIIDILRASDGFKSRNNQSHDKSLNSLKSNEDDLIPEDTIQNKESMEQEPSLC